MIYKPIPIKKIPHCPLLDIEDIEEYNIYNGILLNNNIIERPNSLIIENKFNDKNIYHNKTSMSLDLNYKKSSGHGLATKFNNKSLLFNKHILYVNKKSNDKKILTFYKLNYNNSCYNFIDYDNKKYLITKINNHKYKLYNVLHTITSR